MSIVLASEETVFRGRGKFDLSKSTTAVLLDDTSEQLLQPDEESDLQELDFTGKRIEDSIKFPFFNDEIETDVRASFIGLDHAITSQPKFIRSDGTIGLAPWTSSRENQKYNFMYQLRERNIIDQLVFSVYLSLKPGNGTHVKFGGYDEEGIEGGADRIRFLETDDSSSWSVPMSSVSIGDSQIEYDEDEDGGRFAIFELAYPYIYMPMSDFNEIAAVINR